MSNTDNDDPRQTKAVAIKSEKPSATGSTKAAPRIIAKGEGAVADRILDIAFAEGIKVRQDKDLTELLDAFDVDAPVPLEALHAVSLVLERVYAENRKLADKTDDSAAAEGLATSHDHQATTVDGVTGEAIPVDEQTNDDNTPKGTR